MRGSTRSGTEVIGGEGGVAWAGRVAKEEGEAEEIAFTKYSHWCGNEIDSLKTKKVSVCNFTDWLIILTMFC